MNRNQSLENQRALAPYKQAIARYVRASMTLKGMRYSDLAESLAARGIAITAENLRSKVSKCMFSADLLAVIVDALGAEGNSMQEILKQAHELRGPYTQKSREDQ